MDAQKVFLGDYTIERLIAQQSISKPVPSDNCTLDEYPTYATNQ